MDPFPIIFAAVSMVAPITGGQDIRIASSAGRGVVETIAKTATGSLYGSTRVSYQRSKKRSKKRSKIYSKFRNELKKEARGTKIGKVSRYLMSKYLELNLRNYSPIKENYGIFREIYWSQKKLSMNLFKKDVASNTPYHLKKSKIQPLIYCYKVDTGFKSLYRVEPEAIYTLNTTLQSRYITLQKPSLNNHFLHFYDDYAGGGSNQGKSPAIVYRYQKI